MNQNIVYGALPNRLSIETLQSLCEGTDYKPELITLFFSHIIHRTISVFEEHLPADPEQWVEINVIHRRKLFGNVYAARYIEFMKSNRLLHESGYSVDYKQAQRYKINAELFDLTQPVLYRKIKINGKTSINAYNKLKEQIRSEVRYRLGGVYAVLMDNLKDLHIDLESPKAEEIITEYDLKAPMSSGSKRTYSYYDLLTDINGRDVEFYKRDRFGNRFHTAWSSIKKEVRPLLYFNDCPNEKVVNIDIVNSQPWLSSILSRDLILDLVPEAFVLIGIIEELPNAKGYQEYRDLCHNGKIYEAWREILKREIGEDWQQYIADIDCQHTRIGGKKRTPIDTLKSRDAAKVLLYRVLYGTLKDDCVLSKAFKSQWPGVHQVFQRIKETPLAENPSAKDSYTNLSFLMQRIESSIIISCIGKSLIEDHNIRQFATIHDSFLVPAGKVSKVKSIITEVIKGLGINPPKFKDE